MNKIFYFLFLFSVYTFALDYDIVVKWNGGVESTTEWTIDGNSLHPITINGEKYCHYVGQVISKADNDACGTLTIHHLAKVEAEYKDNTDPKEWLGLHCYYDYNVIGGGYHWRIANLRQTCPDIIVSALQGGKPNVIAEYFFEEGENQAIYYQDGRPIDQTMNIEEEIVNAFGDTYRKQIEYRENYDWVQLKPMVGKPKSKTW